MPRWNGIDDPHDVKIEDARGRESEYEQVRAVPLDALRYWHYTTVSRTPGGFAAFTANKQLPDPNSLFAASVATRCARRDRPEAGRRPRYRKFESISLQRRVHCELAPHGFGAPVIGQQLALRGGGHFPLGTGILNFRFNVSCLTRMRPPTATNAWLGGAILLAAGIWQLTPIKGVCLRHCRSPLSTTSKISAQKLLNLRHRLWSWPMIAGNLEIEVPCTLPAGSGSRPAALKSAPRRETQRAEGTTTRSLARCSMNHLS